MWPAGTRKAETCLSWPGSETSTIWTSPNGNRLPGVSGVVNPRGSRLMNRSLRLRSTSTSSFSQRNIGSALRRTGFAGIGDVVGPDAGHGETSIVVSTKLIEIAVFMSGIEAIRVTFALWSARATQVGRSMRVAAVARAVIRRRMRFQTVQVGRTCVRMSA